MLPWLLLPLLVLACWWFWPRSGLIPHLAPDDTGLLHLRAHWADGSVLVLLRHTERCDRSDAPCLDPPDGITEDGAAAAAAIGKAFERLSLDDALIYFSPVKRTRQTAELSFPGLGSARSWLREGCKENLYRDMPEAKSAGRNLILITHSTCIEALADDRGQVLSDVDFGDVRSYGVALFLVVDGGTGALHPLGYLLADDWEAVEPALVSRTGS